MVRPTSNVVSVHLARRILVYDRVLRRLFEQTTGGSHHLRPRLDPRDLGRSFDTPEASPELIGIVIAPTNGTVELEVIGDLGMVTTVRANRYFALDIAARLGNPLPSHLTVTATMSGTVAASVKVPVLFDTRRKRPMFRPFEIRLGESRTITGTVRLASGAPMEDVSVAVFPEAGGAATAAGITRPDGSFSLEAPADKTVFLALAAPGLRAPGRPPRSGGGGARRMEDGTRARTARSRAPERRRARGRRTRVHRPRRRRSGPRPRGAQRSGARLARRPRRVEARRGQHRPRRGLSARRARAGQSRPDASERRRPRAGHGLGAGEGRADAPARLGRGEGRRRERPAAARRGDHALARRRVVPRGRQPVRRRARDGLSGRGRGHGQGDREAHDSFGARAARRSTSPSR